MRRHFPRLLADEGGATAVEYGVMLTLLTLTILAAWGSAGGALTAKFELIAALLGA